MLKNKSIVVMGGTTGIGLSAAKVFVEHGAGTSFVTGQVLAVDGGWNLSDGQYPD